MGSAALPKFNPIFRSNTCISDEKCQSPAGDFRKKTVHSHKSREGAGGCGRWGNPIFPTWFFQILFLFFLFSRHYEALHRQARDYFIVTQVLPIIAHLQLASHNHDHSPTFSPLHPTPSLPHDSDHAECGGVLCLHGSTPFQYFRVWAI